MVWDWDNGPRHGASTPKHTYPHINALNAMQAHIYAM